MKSRKLKAKKYLLEYLQQINLVIMTIMLVSVFINWVTFNNLIVDDIIIAVVIFQTIFEIATQFIMNDLEYDINRALILERSRRI